METAPSAKTFSLVLHFYTNREILQLPMSLDADGFDRSVSLPPELKVTHIREAI